MPLWEFFLSDSPNEILDNDSDERIQISKHTRSSNKEPERYKYLGLISWSTLEGQLNKDKYDDILKTFAKGVWLGLIIFIDD